MSQVMSNKKLKNYLEVWIPVVFHGILSIIVIYLILMVITISLDISIVEFLIHAKLFYDVSHDIASLVFCLSIATLFNVLHLKFLPESNGQLSKFDVGMILLNWFVCDLAIRFIWLPLQYILFFGIIKGYVIQIFVLLLHPETLCSTIRPTKFPIMAEKISVTIATIINFLFRVTIFLDLTKEWCSSVIGFSSVLILFSVILFLLDNNVVPVRYKNSSKFMYILAETVICLFCIEIFVVLIWSKIEIAIEYVFKTVLMEDELNLYEEMGGDNLVGFIIILIAACFLVYSSIATNCHDQIIGQVLKVPESVAQYLGKFSQNRQNGCLNPPVSGCPGQNQQRRGNPQVQYQQRPGTSEMPCNQNQSPCGPAGDNIDDIINLDCICEHVPANRKTHNKKVTLQFRRTH